MIRCRPVLAAAVLVAGLVAPARAQMMDPPDFSITPAERSQVIEQSLAELNDVYVFPETAKKMAAAVGAKQQAGAYDGITSARELARTLTADLVEVSRDKHLHMRYFAQGAPDLSGDGPPPEQLAAQRDHARRVNYGFEKVERMQGNVGYIEIRGFVPPAIGGETASAAMTMVANADALIVDLRRNTGGEPAMIAYVLSYLFDGPTHLNDIYERVGDITQQFWTLAHVPGRKFGGGKPVYVLTSAETFSGGEEFAYNVKTQKRGTLLGETTGGGAHPVRGVKVGDRFVLGIPFARAINPITRTNWEGTGVEPDIAMPAGDALDAAYTMALERIVQQTTDERQREQLRGLLAERRKGKS